jgi:anaerobic magnesium-protoporphyrin IX monomethyl ester cyclase
MKVLLVNPPTFNELVGITPGDVEESRGFTPPLGLLFVADYLQRHTSHTVEILDTQPPGWDYQQLKEVLRKRDFDVCGVSAMTFTLIDALKVCRIVRRVNPSAKIVMGGPHIHLYPTETLHNPEVDFLIQGEGEIAFSEFLDKMHNPSLWPEVKGLAYRDPSGEIIDNGLAPIVEDLDELGSPARHLIDQSAYYSVLGDGDRYTTMFTTRGCPFRCTFCYRPDSPILARYRYTSPEKVVEEMEICEAQGIREIKIYDDTFTVRQDRVHEICDLIIKRGLKVRWDVRAHVNTIDQDLLRHMAEANCNQIHYGVEAGNDRMLKEIKKNSTVSRIKEAFKLTQEEGMGTLAYFIIGQQTETLSDIHDSIQLASELGPDFVLFSIFIPLPGTDTYLKGLERGMYKNDAWAEFAQNPTSDFQVPVWEENFTREELVDILTSCYRKFYFRPSYISQRLIQIRSFSQLYRQARAGFRLINMKSKGFFDNGVEVR